MHDSRPHPSIARSKPPNSQKPLFVMPLKSSRHSLLVRDVHGGGGDTTCCWWRSTLFFLSFIQILC